MAQKKLVRFAELNTFDNVLQFPGDIKGNWKAHFKNEHPLTLELACGKGEYALGLGRLYPGRNFIGVDIKGNRLWAGARKALREGLDNVAFLRVQIEQLHQYFAPGEVSEIWITFPDPQLRFFKGKKKTDTPAFFKDLQTADKARWHYSSENRQSQPAPFHKGGAGNVPVHHFKGQR